jgi:hypothetical protein
VSDGIVFLTVDFTAAPGTDTQATVERGTSATGPWALIGSADLLAEVGIFYDTTAPLDTLVWYRWTGNVSGTQIVQGPYIEVSTGTVLVKDPLRPWANLELFFCTHAEQALAAVCAPDGPDLVWVGFGETKVRRADANLFNVYQSAVPIDVYGRRKRLDGDLRIFSKTLAALEAVETLFTGGGPIQIQTPAEYGLPNIIVQPMDLSETYISRDQRRPYRLWEAPFTIVDAPFGPKQGTAEANWCLFEDTFATMADAAASGLTWGQVAAGEGLGPDIDGFGEGLFGDGPYGDGG